jgi:hypothetical protein
MLWRLAKEILHSSMQASSRSKKTAISPFLSSNMIVKSDALRNLRRVVEMSRCEPFSIMLIQAIMKCWLSSHWYMLIRLQLYLVMDMNQ